MTAKPSKASLRKSSLFAGLPASIGLVDHSQSSLTTSMTDALKAERQQREIPGHAVAIPLSFGGYYRRGTFPPIADNTGAAEAAKHVFAAIDETSPLLTEALKGMNMPADAVPGLTFTKKSRR